VKLFVSIDLEGCTGVVAEDQIEPGRPAYEGALRLMQGDLDAVIEGCLAGGADEIVVCDGHDRGANLSPARLPPTVRLVGGSPRPLGMMAGIDESFDAALLVGYHARAGTTAGVLDHTYAYKVFRVRVDDMIEAGELALNAAVAGCFGVPVVFVSGDEATVAEAREVLPAVTAVAVKVGRARTSARLLAPEATRILLRDGCGPRSGPQRSPGTNAPYAWCSRAATTATRPRPAPESSASTRARSASRVLGSSTRSPRFSRRCASRPRWTDRPGLRAACPACAPRTAGPGPACAARSAGPGPSRAPRTAGPANLEGTAPGVVYCEPGADVA
jgi:D-amino peptidase